MKVFCAIITVMLSVGLPAGAALTNILSNGGFDNDVIPDGTQINNPPTPYDAWGAYTSLGHAIFNPSASYPLQPVSGDNFLYTGGLGYGVDQHVTLTPGMTYQLSAHVARLASDAYAGYVFALWDGVSDDNTLAIGDLFNGVYGIEVGPSGDSASWVYVETGTYTATAADAGKDYRVQLIGYDGGGWFLRSV